MDATTNQYRTALIEELRGEINNLMAVAQLITPVIREQEERRYENYLAFLNKSLYSLLRTLRNMEYMQHCADGSNAFHVQTVDFAALCRTLSDEIAPLAERGKVRFSCCAEGYLLLQGDPDLLKRMLLNLISNALRAAEEGGEAGEAGIRLISQKHRAVVTVWDNGTGDTLPGAPKETTKNGIPAETQNGLGLGLLIARQIAELHGGTIVFERREARGVHAIVSLDAQMPKQPSTILYTPRIGFDTTGGFSTTLVELSGVLPHTAFLPADVE